MFELIQNLDLGILRFINDNLHNPIMDKIMVIITTLGNKGAIWIVITLIFLITKRYRKVGIMMACGLILNAILGEVILKNIIQRGRPFINFSDISLLIKIPTTYSFPSGHTASSFVAVGIIFGTLKKYRWQALALAILIAFSRMYLFVHYPSDIIGGVILGIISSRIILGIWANSIDIKNK